MIMKPAIIVIAYNRYRALKRLLGSIGDAYYGPEDIPLVISIDKGGSQEVERVARDFIWKHGEKRVIVRNENLGLKRHVIECSDLTKEYGSAIILEDDLYVARDFYEYAAAALEFTDKDKRIAGVSLYDHLLNVHAREPFEAIDDGYDNWYFQFASSWGQAYTKDQWEGFKTWLSENDNTPFPDTVPENVRSWGNGSWLKYYIRYMIEKDLYFLYPRVSRTTNFSDEGTHRMGQPEDLQVPLSMAGAGRGFRFSALSESKSVYDAYFENEWLRDSFPEAPVMDLYGKKPKAPYSGYMLTRNPGRYDIIRSYGRSLRPLDANIINDIPGEVFFLIDLKQGGEYDVPRKGGDRDLADRAMYNYRAFRVKYGLAMAFKRFSGFFFR